MNERYEKDLFRVLERMADALERIADAVEASRERQVEELLAILAEQDGGVVEPSEDLNDND